jgi:hypothetical protein
VGRLGGGRAAQGKGRGLRLGVRAQLQGGAAGGEGCLLWA